MIAVYLAMLETDVDRDKFMKLYESYEKKLFAVALRILENNEKAEDAVQQAWLRIIQHWERVSCLEWDLAGGYAVTTVKNAAIDILRQEKRVEPLPATWDPPAREESQDEYQYLVSLIQTLPDTYRRILELKYVEEYSNREIAKRLKMNEATVATRARRGKMMLLFRALIGANQLEFKENMDSAESAEYSYSPRYNRFRLQILADPFRWAKKRRRPMWQKIITNVACIILVCSIALGGLMVVSPTDRASWRPTWLPEGWVVTDIYSRSSRSWWSFKDSNGSGASLTCACFDPSEESMSTIIDTDEIDKAHTTVTIQEYTADLYEGENDALLVWEDKNGYLFWIKGWMVDRETVEQIANSMTYYQEDGISYEVDEIPDGYEMKFQFESNGAMQNEWVKSGSVLTWQYITNPLCPWEEPSREYELVNVSGVQAKYWPNLVSEEEAYIDSTAGAQFSARIDYGIERTAVLMWEDLETNTIFRLRGVLSKEDILYMAESMTRSEKSNKT